MNVLSYTLGTLLSENKFKIQLAVTTADKNFVETIFELSFKHIQRGN
jgi:hypothetical protein